MWFIGTRENVLLDIFKRSEAQVSKVNNENMEISFRCFYNLSSVFFIRNWSSSKFIFNIILVF